MKDFFRNAKNENSPEKILLYTVLGLIVGFLIKNM